MSFFKIIISLCSGNSVFPRLLNISMFRVLLHSVLMLVLCMLLITVGNTFNFVRDFPVTMEKFFENLGAVEISEKALGVKNNPDKKQAYIITSSLRFDYFPGDKPELSSIDEWSSILGIVYMRDGLTCWRREGDGYYRALYFSPSELAYHTEAYAYVEKGISLREQLEMNLKAGNAIESTLANLKTGLTRQTLTEYIAEKNKNFRSSVLSDEPGDTLVASPKIIPTVENDDDDDDDAGEPPESILLTRKNKSATHHVTSISSPGLISITAIFGMITFYLSFSIVQILFSFLFPAFFFALAQHLRVSAQPTKLSLRNTIQIIIYAAFAPLLLASLLTAFFLPLAMFQVIFFIAFFINHLLAFSSVLKHLNPAKPEENDDF